MKKVLITREEFNPHPLGLCKMTTSGNITEIMQLQHKNESGTITRLNADLYIVNSTGELREYNHTTNRAENSAAKSRMAASMKSVRDIINCNCTELQNCRWMTFTYAENMTDPKRLCSDRQAFWQRVKRWHKKNELPAPEYISICEPQGRGAWHLHELWIYPRKAPFLPNHEIAQLWQHGFVTVKKLDSCDNVGAYLTAYLCDVPLDEYDGTVRQQDIKVAEITMEDGTKTEKKLVKGARLHLYPPGMNFYRTSRGIKRPTSEWMLLHEAKEKVRGATLTYSSVVRLVDGSIATSSGEPFTNDILYEYYNSARTSSQHNAHTVNTLQRLDADLIPVNGPDPDDPFVR